MIDFSLASRMTVLTSVLAIAVGACSPTRDPVHKRAASVAVKDKVMPPEISCAAVTNDNGSTIIQYRITNIGSETTYVLEGRRMPYQIARDSNTLVILYGFNEAESDVIYEFPAIMRSRPLVPGEVLTGEVALGQKLLRGPNTSQPTPASLLHGRIRVRCEVGWGATPIADPEHFTTSELVTWQSISGFGPFDVVLP